MEKTIDPKRLKKRSDHIFQSIRAAALLLLFCYLLWASGLKEFWYDEVATMGFIRSSLSLGDVLHYYRTIEVTNLPLYAIIEYFFYHFLPPEEIWLLLPGILMTLGGIRLLVRVADRMIGRKAAYTVLAMCVFSTTIINRLALELRTYALLFFASVLVLDCLIGLYKKTDIRQIVITSFVMVIMAYTHYFGILYLAVLGIGILYGIMRKKRDRRLFLPFFIAAVVFLPWFFTAMQTKEVNTGEFWIAPPGWKELPETVGYLMGGSYLLCVLYGIGFLLLIFDLIKSKDFCSFRSLYGFTGPVIMLVIFIYSRWINPEGGLYENRYFIVILPCILLTAAYGAERIIGAFQGRTRRIVEGAVIFYLAVSCIFMGLRSITDSRQQYARYSYAADCIIREQDLGDEDVLLVCSSYDDVGEAVLQGWYDYYLLRRGYEASHLKIVQESSLDVILMSDNDGQKTAYRKIYVVGDTDHITYQGEDYTITVQEPFYKITILERQPD